MDHFEDHRNLALEFDQVYFNYNSNGKKKSVLSGINLKAPKGAVYGLLGSSGCGKTTLLRCALGRLPVHHGKISLFGKKPGTSGCNVPGPGVGYMPQELALYMEFTIKETLTYFGQIFSMREIDINARTKFLINLLQLPDENCFIKKLSGGQQRRVSLATALIHSPPLLILDEPTVGVDPLLRQSIWLYLHTLCNSGLTVILTTHYIEEAKSAKVVGFMRSGGLLAEGQPEQLMNLYNSTSLESVFLRLCLIDTPKHNDNDSHQIEFTKSRTEFDLMQMRSNFSISDLNEDAVLPKAIVTKEFDSNDKNGIINPAFSIGNSVLELNKINKMEPFPTEKDPPIQMVIGSRKLRILPLIRKNFKQLTNNWVMLLFFIILPTVEIFLLVNSIGLKPNGVKVSVFDGDKSDWSANFINFLSSKSLLVINYSTPESAIEAVRVNDAWCAIIIKENFAEALRLRQVFGSIIDNKTLDQSNIRVHNDMSNQIIGYHILRVIYEAFKDFAEAIAASLGISSTSVKIPIVVEPPIYGDKKQSLISYIAPGALIMVAYFATNVITCHLLIGEHQHGLVERSLVAGVLPVEFVLSHAFTQVIVLIIQVALMVTIAFGYFHMTLFGSAFTAISLIFLQGICGLVFGLMVSAICHDELYANLLAIGTFFPSVIVGGLFWPLESMPNALRYFSYLLPSTLAIESERCIMLRGWNFEYFQVTIGFIITVFWLAVFLVGSIVFFKRKF